MKYQRLRYGSVRVPRSGDHEMAWRQARRLPGGVMSTSKRTPAAYGYAPLLNSSWCEYATTSFNMVFISSPFIVSSTSSCWFGRIAEATSDVKSPAATDVLHPPAFCIAMSACSLVCKNAVATRLHTGPPCAHVASSAQ